jgi:hypothetical protein
MQMQPTAPVQPMQPMQQQMPAPMPAQIQMPMEPIDTGELEFASEEPMSTQSDSGLPAEFSQMTVSDFLQKCKNVDSLVCMGIEAFIEKNKDAFMSDSAAIDKQVEDELKDVEFGAEKPAPEDLPELEFPMEPAQGAQNQQMM